MQFMLIFTYEPEKRDEIIKRLQIVGTEPPAGIKVLGEWSDITGGRAFRVIEVDDPKAIFAGNIAWTDLARIEAVPILPMKDVIKLLPTG